MKSNRKRSPGSTPDGFKPQSWLSVVYHRVEPLTTGVRESAVSPEQEFEVAWRGGDGLLDQMSDPEPVDGGPTRAAIDWHELAKHAPDVEDDERSMPAVADRKVLGLSFRMSRAMAHSSTAPMRWRTSLTVAALTCQIGERISRTSPHVLTRSVRAPEAVTDYKSSAYGPSWTTPDTDGLLLVVKATRTRRARSPLPDAGPPASGPSAACRPSSPRRPRSVSPRTAGRRPRR